MDTPLITYLVPVAGLLALGYAFLTARWVGRQDAGNERMAEIAAAISEGARAFLNREYRVLGIFVLASLADECVEGAQRIPCGLIQSSFSFSNKLMIRYIWEVNSGFLLGFSFIEKESSIYLFHNKYMNRLSVSFLFSYILIRKR